MKPIGSDGRPIPTPPIARPWRDELLATGKLGLVLGCFFVLIGPTINLIANSASLGRGGAEIGLTLLRAVGACLVAGQLVAAAFVLAYLAAWPLIRGGRGRKLERQIDRFSPTMLVQMIESARAKADAAQDARLRCGWVDWADWLQARAAMRRTLSRGPLSWTVGPKPGALAVAGALPALLVGFSVWMVAALAGQAPEPWLYLLPAGLCAYAAYSLCKVATLKIELTADRLVLRRFWRPVWSAPREAVVVWQNPRTGLYGVLEKATGREVGAIAASPFRANDLEMLADWFSFSGGAVDDPAAP